jgi:hypothetical protein
MTSHNFGWTISNSEARGTVPRPIPLNGIELDTHTALSVHEQTLTSQTSLGRHADKEVNDKPLGIV